MRFLRSLLFNLLFLPFTALACILGQVLLLGPPARLHAYVRGWARAVLWLLRVTCGIGVRIEDDVLVTADGCESLSAGIPRTADEVEAWMARGRS